MKAKLNDRQKPVVLNLCRFLAYGELSELLDVKKEAIVRFLRRYRNPTERKVK